MDEVSRKFLKRARYLLSEDYLPKIERCLGRLSEADVWWRAGSEANSVGNLLLHVAGNARQWIVSGVGGSPDERVRQSEFDSRGGLTKAELLDNLRLTVGEVDAVLERLDPATVLDSRKIQGFDVTVLEAVFHVVEHFSMHTGQIILITKMLTQSDMRFYDFSGGKPKENWKNKP